MDVTRTTAVAALVGAVVALLVGRPVVQRRSRECVCDVDRLDVRGAVPRGGAVVR